jgi:hypothetical protein
MTTSMDIDRKASEGSRGRTAKVGQNLQRQEKKMATILPTSIYGRYVSRRGFDSVRAMP